MANKEINILKTALEFVKRTGLYPKMEDLVELGITRAAMRHKHGNLETLKQLVAASSPYIFDLNYASASRKPTKNRLVITTAVTGAKLDKQFYKNLKAYCAKFNAELIVLVSNSNNKDLTLDPLLREEIIITNDISLNDNLFILGIKNQAKTTDPITGLPRIGQRNGTFVSASPKQRLKLVATGTSKLPHALMSTGAITHPEYNTGGILIDKSSYLAEADHVMGAVIVELDKHNTFHYRQIQADNKGSFVDLGDYFNKGTHSKMKPEAFVVGDWHSGDTDPTVVKCLLELNKALKPKYWFMHDLFDGLSVNPHTTGKSVVRAKLAADGKLMLKNELDGLKADLEMLSSKVSNIIVVSSNHDDFLNRYLDNALYVGDDNNHRLALELAIHSLDGKNPLEEYVGKKKNVRWLRLDQSCKVAGVECGMHGHLGGNGSRGSITQMETAYGEVMFGHSHTPGILRGSWNVGTSTYLELGYNKGASSWFQTSGIIYPNGQKQLINFIDGRYTTKEL